MNPPLAEALEPTCHGEGFGGALLRRAIQAVLNMRHAACCTKQRADFLLFSATVPEVSLMEGWPE